MYKKSIGLLLFPKIKIKEKPTYRLSVFGEKVKITFKTGKTANIYLSDILVRYNVTIDIFTSKYLPQSKTPLDLIKYCLFENNMFGLGIYYVFEFFVLHYPLNSGHPQIADEILKTKMSGK